MSRVLVACEVRFVLDGLGVSNLSELRTLVERGREWESLEERRQLALGELGEAAMANDPAIYSYIERTAEILRGEVREPA